MVVLAQTSPNGAGNVGWDRSAVVLGWRESSEFSTGMGNPFGVGSIQVGDGDEIPYETYYPVVERIDQQEGSRPGSFYPMLMRLSALTDELAEEVEFTINGATQTLRPFTFSPKKYYVVGTDESRPRIFVVTTQELLPGLEEIKPENLIVTAGQGYIRVKVQSEGGGVYPLADADITVIEEAFQESTGPLQVPSGPVDMPTLLMYYQLLYGETGLRLLGYYLQAGGEIELHDRWIPFSGDWDVDWLGDDHVTIQIEEDISPIQAAQHLAAGLRTAMAHNSVKSIITQHEDFEALKETYRVTVEEAAKVASVGANLYLNGIAVFNIGADIALTIDDLSESQWISVIGLLPFIPNRVGTTGELIIKRLDNGQELHRFSKQAIDAVVEAMEAPTFAAQFDILEQSLTIDQRWALVRGRLLRAPTQYSGLRKRMLEVGEDAMGFSKEAAEKAYGYVNAHHDFAWQHRDWFIAHGIDVNDPAYGRWVKARKPNTPRHPTMKLHQEWHAGGTGGATGFQADWNDFMEAEAGLIQSTGNGYTKQQIIDFMENTIRPKFRAEGIPR